MFNKHVILYWALAVNAFECAIGLVLCPAFSRKLKKDLTLKTFEVIRMAMIDNLNLRLLLGALLLRCAAVEV